MWTRRGQGGFTLLESIISIALISLVILALATGMLLSVRGSRAATETQRLDSAVSSVTESLKTAPYPSVMSGCPTLTDFQGAWASYADRWQDPDVDVTITGVENWDGSASTYSAGCPGTNPLAQRLTIHVQIDDIEADAQVVVSKP